MDKLPKLYAQLISQTAFLKVEGMSDKELEILRNLGDIISEQCAAVSQFEIPETLVQLDFNTNNMLLDLTSKKMSLIDLGELVITHPLFSLNNFLLQATIYHNVKQQDLIYNQLRNVCRENWLDVTKNEILDLFILVKKLWPIYSALAYYRFMISVDQRALKYFYANRPNLLVTKVTVYSRGSFPYPCLCRALSIASLAIFTAGNG